MDRSPEVSQQARSGLIGTTAGVVAVADDGRHFPCLGIRGQRGDDRPGPDVTISCPRTVPVNGFTQATRPPEVATHSAPPP